MTLADLRAAVLAHLGDPEQIVWSGAEVDSYLQDANREVTGTLRVLPDWTYLENLPAGFSATAKWEVTFSHARFQYGIANYTMSDEARLLDETRALGPANHTSPFEATDRLLGRAAASTAIPATAELPASVTEIERVLWDQRTIDVLSRSRLQAHDTRYELTEGEVYGYLWRQDGVRTLRKVRKPAAQAETYVVNGSWGLLRDADEVSL